MRSNDFAFWLQGYFELREEGLPLNPRQLGIVKAHLALVRETEGKKLGGFPEWLQGTLDAMGDQPMDERLLRLVEKRLANEFEHVIDPLYEKGKNKQNLDWLHGGGAGDTLIRC